MCCRDLKIDDLDSHTDFFRKATFFFWVGIDHQNEMTRRVVDLELQRHRQETSLLRSSELLKDAMTRDSPRWSQ